MAGIITATTTVGDCMDDPQTAIDTGGNHLVEFIDGEGNYVSTWDGKTVEYVKLLLSETNKLKQMICQLRAELTEAHGKMRLQKAIIDDYLGDTDHGGNE